MCGIYGAMSVSAAQEKVFLGLQRLEYRGYDSWGVAALTKKDIVVEKYVGQIGQQTGVLLPSVSTALGHTRWATHGGVTVKNAHPHLSTDHEFAVVHNGVIENFQELKEELVDRGYKFVSETDTEVIVGLLEQFSKTLPMVEGIREVFKRLEGRNTFAVLTNSGEVYAVRDGSPLVIGKSKNGWFFSSDIASLAQDADQFYAVPQRHGVVINSQDVVVFSVDSEKNFKPDWQKLLVSSLQIDKGEYNHFMQKEIYDQAKVLSQVIQQPLPYLEKSIRLLQKARKVFIIGAGSASFAAGQLAYLLRQAGKDATLVPAYMFSSYLSLVQAEDVCIAISQSGETADTLEAVEWFQERGTTLISLVNMPGSSLSTLSDLSFMLQVGTEAAVGSTKALTGQMCWGWCLAALVKNTFVAGGDQFKLAHQNLLTALQNYQEVLGSWLQDVAVQDKLKHLAIKIAQHQNLFILGRGQLFFPALEFALKMKEISYIHAEGFNAGELKHGVIALIEDGTPVICLITNDEERESMLSAAQEVRSRGAMVIGVSTENNAVFDEWISIPKFSDLIFVSSIIPAQILSYHAALYLGYDPDKPRNLAKSVTVK